MLELNCLSFSYSEKPVFQDLSLQFPDGSRTAILGRSGLGKTTLLRLIAGLLQPTSGQVTGVPERGIGMVFQEDRLLPNLTAGENLRLVRPDLDSEALRSLFDELGLAGCESLYPGQLSGGMSRRVSIARALCFGSPLLILDEPLKGLDEQTHAQVLHCILRHSRGSTLLLVTHSQTEAEALGCTPLLLESCMPNTPFQKGSPDR
ncbi:MAG: ABC transporter ATP-binding protein [Clostridiales bacterium]|nr:ABC transporter ATP-binding protein [Clostridiales bacterium]